MTDTVPPFPLRQFLEFGIEFAKKAGKGLKKHLEGPADMKKTILDHQWILEEEIPKVCQDHLFEKEGKNRKGFSLLELLFALGILSLGVLFLNGLSITTLKADKNSQNRTAALQLAQEKIESMKTLAFSELRGEVESGLKIGTLGTLFQRETLVQKENGSSLADISVRVLWPSPSNPKNLQFTELFTRIAG
ncbi:MAG: hypothetical protein C0407_04855 [Desulfobacca sp.]|nr:hypothetical protein [Desulfobacca sp.]